MGKVIKRPIVINDLIELATSIADGNLDISDDFLLAAEKTFIRLGNFPHLGKLCKFNHSNLVNVRQKAIKGFENYLIFIDSLKAGLRLFELFMVREILKTF